MKQNIVLILHEKWYSVIFCALAFELPELGALKSSTTTKSLMRAVLRGAASTGRCWRDFDPLLLAGFLTAVNTRSVCWTLKK
jgi:hypothetical protein